MSTFAAYAAGWSSWLARYFDLVEVADSSSAPATKKQQIMKVLTLSIKQQYFDEILAGTKTHEYREIRPNNGKKYFRYKHLGKLYTPQVDDDKIPEDENPIELVPVEYDAIKLLTGAYSGKRPYIVVKVKKADVVLLTDEKGEDLTYEWTDGKEYIAAQMDYELGEIIEKHLNV